MNQKSVHQIWQLLGIVVIFNALLSTVFMLSVSSSDIWLSSFKTSLFLPSALFAHFSFLFFLVTIPLVLAYKLNLRRLSWQLLALLIFSGLLITIFFNSIVFSLYRFHLNSMSVNLLFGGAANEILSFSPSMWLNVGFIILTITAFEFILIKWLFNRSKLSGKKTWLSLLFLMVTTQLFYGFSDAIGDTTITQQLRYIPWAQPLTMKRTLRKLGILDVAKTQPSLRLTKTKHSSLNYPISPLACSNDEKLNYLLLIVDSTRADMLNSEVMPNTFDFAKNAIVFNQHFSSSNSTRFGLFGLFYGLPATYWFQMLEEQKGSVLFDILLDKDYQFHLDAAAPLNSPEFDRTIFSAVRDKLQWAEKNSNIEKDTVVINRLIDFLDQDFQKNFFAFGFLDAPHGYSLPKDEEKHFKPALDHVNYLSLHNDYDPEEFLNLYKSAIYYNDRLLGRVYKKLEEKNLLDNTVVIITSDHGQEFNDLKQNYWGHNSNFSKYQTQVPLVIHWPNKKHEIISHLSSHEDIIPSIMKYGLNCENAVSDYSTGHPLFDKDSLPEKRNLLLSNWNMRTIYTGDSYYNFHPTGGTEVLDRNFQKKKDQSTDAGIIKENLKKMAQYLK